MLFRLTLMGLEGMIYQEREKGHRFPLAVRDFFRRPVISDASVLTVPSELAAALLRPVEAGRKRKSLSLTPAIWTTLFPPALTRQLPLLLAVLMLYSIVIASPDIHPDATYKDKCIRCQLNHDLSCAKETVFFLLQPPIYKITTVVNEKDLFLCSPRAFSVGSRGPPLTLPGFLG
jgi:hypothetical protein